MDEHPTGATRPTLVVPAAAAGNVAGHLLASVAVNRGMHAADEVGGSIDADGRRLANAVADKLEAWFQAQGWLSAGSS